MTSYLDNLALFPEAAVSRGEAYFRSGKVLSLDEKDGQVLAKVEGSHGSAYEVMLRFSKNGKTLLRASCSCPCYGDCKHMVAVLFALEERERTSLPKGYDGAAASYLKTLETWERNDRYVSSSFLRKALFSLTGLLKKEEIFSLLAKTYVAFARKEYLSNLPFGSLSFPELSAMVEGAYIPKEDFVSMAMAEAKEGESFLPPIAFKGLLANKAFLPAASSYFLRLYETDREGSLSLLKTVDVPLSEGVKLDPAFLSLFFVHSKTGPILSYVETLLQSQEIEKNPKILYKTLLFLMRVPNHERLFKVCFLRYKELWGEDRALAIGKAMLESNPSFEDLLLLLGSFSKEEFLRLYISIQNTTYRPFFDFLAFYLFPYLGPFDPKKISLSFYVLSFDGLDEAKKRYAQKEALRFLSSKRKLVRKDEGDVFSSLLLLALANDGSALAYLHDDRVSSFLKGLRDGGRGIYLSVSSLSEEEKERDFILSKGGVRVSL